MDLLGLLLIASMAGSSPAQDSADFPGADAWKETWRELDALASAPPGSSERRRIAVELEAFQARHERSARKRQNRPEAFRSRVLAAQLARVGNAPFQAVADPGVPIAWLPGEAWIVAEVVGPGPTRVSAIEGALAEAMPKELGERATFAFATAAADARDLHWDQAYDVARALDARIQSASRGDLPAEPRIVAKTAGLLAFVSRMRGDHDRALAILQTRLESATEADERAALLVEMGRARLASGQVSLAARDLGEALALGSMDAAWILGRSALSEQARGRACALFRSLVSGTEGEPPPRPALRGYGLSLLPDAPPTEPSTRNLPSPPR